MAFPALRPGKYLAAGFDALRSDFRLGWNLDGRSRLFIRPARGEVLHPGYEIGALLLGEGAPLRHVRAVEAARDSVEKVLVGGQGARRSGAAFEDAQFEVAGLGVDPGKALAISVSEVPMATDAIPSVVALGILGMTSDVADVAFHAHARLQVVLGELRPRRNGKRQSNSCAQ